MSALTPPCSPKELIRKLEKRFDFAHNTHDEIEEWDEGLFETLEENTLVFNWEGDYICECDDPDDPTVERIYKWILRKGWSLIEHPLDMNCWLLAPTSSCTRPLKLVDLCPHLEETKEAQSAIRDWNRKCKTPESEKRDAK